MLDSCSLEIKYKKYKETKVKVHFIRLYYFEHFKNWVLAKFLVGKEGHEIHSNKNIASGVT